MTASPTATDYRWFEERFPGLAEAYCITLVRDLSPTDVLARLGGRTEPARTGVTAMVEASFAHLDRAENSRQFLAMTTVRDWTLLIEPNGCLGVSEESALPASAGTRWVSHFVDIEGHEAFLWAEDTVSRVQFEPGTPDHRWGTTPDELLDAMHDCGFQFWSETSDTAEFLCDKAAFALAEHLTGVRLTPDLLQDTTYVCRSVKTG
ncbi:DUF6461 domain-containing protein [Streptomyces sp. NPDC091292]|uniref:DUF6461 domain-containing protein n=1 Tax=Streptomyces sp. NPDC091292 TaxID=3365991 RepID=UPI0037FA694B